MKISLRLKKGSRETRCLQIAASTLGHDYLLQPIWYRIRIVFETVSENRVIKAMLLRAVSLVIFSITRVVKK